MTAAFAMAMVFATQDPCPKLAGRFGCVLKDGHYSPLVIRQWQAQHQMGITYYSVDYTAIPGQPDVWKASARGEWDQHGWITQCKKDRLVSTSRDHLHQQEIYLDRDGDYTYTLNGKVTLSCPKIGAQK